MTARTRRSVIGGLAAAGGAAVLGRQAGSQDAKFFRIGTGPTESSAFAIGTLIGNAISSPPGGRECDRGGSCGVPGLIAVTQTTAGSVANIEAIAAKRLESGLCQADIAYWAFHGTGLYRRQGAVTNLRAIANLFPEHLHVVARRGAQIRDLRALRGRAVSLGERDSGELVTARAVLQALGVAERDLKAQFLKPTQAAEAMLEGRLDAFFLLAAVPSVVVADLGRAIDIDLLPVTGQGADRLRSAYPFFDETSIPAGAYSGMPTAPTISVGMLWLVAAEAEEAVVHGLTRALWHPNNRRLFEQGPPVARQMRREDALEGLTLQLHPGAALYYFEAGLVK